MKIPFFAKPEKLSAEEELRYLRDCELISALLAKHGLNVKPYQDKSLVRLRKHQNPKRVIEVWSQYRELLTEATEAGDDILDTGKLVWRMLRKLRLTPREDIFDKIQKQNIVEIYTVDNWQIFRNLEFFKFVSMSLDELATFNWAKDSKRSAKITLMAIESILKIKLGIMRDTLDMRDWPEHQVLELLGDGWLISIAMQYASPLRNENKQLVGFISLNNTRILSKTPRAEAWPPQL